MALKRKTAPSHLQVGKKTGSYFEVAFSLCQHPELSTLYNPP
jgi:hypothetical protein